MSKGKTTGVLLLLVSFFSAARSAAGPTSSDPLPLDRYFTVRNWTMANGLPDDRVTAIHQTRDGFLWIGTAHGLARFDGTDFVVFNSANTPALARSDHINCLAQSGNGSLWVSTGNDVVRLTSTGAFESPFPSGFVGVLSADPSGRVWLLNHDGSIWLHDGQSFAKITPPRGYTPYSFGFDPAGTPCITIEGRMLVCDFPSKAWREATSGAGRDAVQHAPAPTRPFLLSYPSAQQAAIWTPQRGRWKREHSEEVLGREVRCLLQHDDLLWGVFHDGVVFQFELEQRRLTEFRRTWVPGGAPTLHYLDREGSIWLGADAGGVHRLQPRLFHNVDQVDGLPDPNVRAVLPAGANSVWVGTDGGLARLTVQERSGRPVGRVELAQFSSRAQTVRVLAYDADETLFLGTHDGLWCLTNGAAVALPSPRSIGPFDPDGKASRKIRGVLRVGREALLVADASDVQEWRPGTSLPVTWSEPTGDLRRIIADRSGRVWIASHRNGVHLFTFRDRPAPHFEASGRFSRTNGLASDSAYNLHEDHSGAMWIMTEGALHRVPPFATGEVPPIGVVNQQNGLPVPSVHGLLEDDLGFTWLPSDYGVLRVRSTDLIAATTGQGKGFAYTLYTEADGLPTAECNGQYSAPACAKTPDGTLFFPPPTAWRSSIPGGQSTICHCRCRPSSM